MKRIQLNREAINILSPWFPPAYKAGGPLQSLAGLVGHLTGNGFKFQVFTSNKDLDGTVLDVVADTWVNYNAGTKVWYSSDNNIIPLIKKETEQAKPACLYIIGIYDWHYNIKPLLLVKGVKKIVSVRGMLHPGALTQKAYKKKAFLYLLKLWGWQRRVIFHVTDENEKLYVERALGIEKEEIMNYELGIEKEEIMNYELGIKNDGQEIKNDELRIKNDGEGIMNDELRIRNGGEGIKNDGLGIKNDELRIRNENARIRVAGNFPNLFERMAMPEKEAGKLKLVSVGLVSPMKNYLLVLEALKEVSRFSLEGVSGYSLEGVSRYSLEGVFRFSLEGLKDVSRFSLVSIQYDIYGPIKDKGYWEQCTAVINTLPDNIVVNYHGAIEPSAVGPALAASHVFILPSKSENYGHSIVEALSAGRPVITSNGTPWNGLREAYAGINVDVGVNGQWSTVTDGSGDGKGSRDSGGQEFDVVAIGNKQLAISNGLSDAIIFFVNTGQQELQEWSEGARTYVNKAINVEEIKEAYLRLFGV